MQEETALINSRTEGQEVQAPNMPALQAPRNASSVFLAFVRHRKLNAMDPKMGGPMGDQTQYTSDDDETMVCPNFCLTRF